MDVYEDIKKGIEEAITYEKGTRETNKTTLEAMEEVKRMKADPSLGKSYRNVDEMIKDLLA